MAVAHRRVEGGRARSSSSLAVIANGDSFARWQISLASIRPSRPHRAGRGGTRAPAGSSPTSAAAKTSADTTSASGPRRDERILAQGVACDDPHARLALLARLGEQQSGAVCEPPPRDAEARLAAQLLVRHQPPALHQVHDERERSTADRGRRLAGGRVGIVEAQQQVLAPPSDSTENPPDSVPGVGRDRLEGGERERLESLEHSTAERIAQPLGVGLDLGQLRHRTNVPEPAVAVGSGDPVVGSVAHVVAQRREASPTCSRAAAPRTSTITSPPSLSRPCMKVAWAEVSPRAISTAVS